jgi:hypothetical protein
MALHEPQTGDRIIGPFRSVASSTHRGHLQAPQPEVAGSNPPPATRQNGLGSIVSVAVFCYL